MENAILDYYSNIEPKEIDWLWYPYIPYGKLTIIQGDPGEGKSTFVINLVALLTRGEPMPDGYRLKEPGVAIYQCAEDGMADTIKPRLEQAGADCDKVAYILDDDIALTLEDGRIEDAIQQSGAKLFIIDPLQAFIPPDTDMLNAAKMRSVMRKLAKVAEDNHCAVILIGHMNKAASGKSLYRGLGSIDIAAIARSILMITRDEHRPHLRYIYPIKSSLAPEGDAIGFTFKEGGGLEWQGKFTLPLAKPKKDTETPTPVKTSKLAQAKAKMSMMLLKGDLPAKKVYSELTRFDIGTRTIEKAKKELNVVTYRSKGSWYWSLPQMSIKER